MGRSLPALAAMSVAAIRSDGPARPHETHRNPPRRRRILHERAETGEAPREGASPLGAPNRGPPADHPKVVQGDHPLRGVGPHDDAPGDAVVRRAAIVRLTTPDAVEGPPGPSGPRRPKMRSQAVDMGSHPVHALRRAGRALRVPERYRQVLEGTASLVMHRDHPNLRLVIRHGQPGSPGHYVGTVGQVSEETVARYVRDQKARTGGRTKRWRASSPQLVGGSPPGVR